MELVFYYILFACLVDSLLALIGAITLVTRRNLQKLILILVAFAAGALLGGAFFHLMSESLTHLNPDLTFMLTLLGFFIFLLLEHVLRWRHCHKEKCNVHPFGYLCLVGDGLHNFTDGVIIAASFMISPTFGFITTLLVFLHEIPQELGDFGVLLFAGFTPKKALFYNFLSQLTCVLGGVVGYYFGSLAESFSPLILSIAAGGFLYIATTDLIPRLRMKGKNTTLLLFLLGVIFLYLLKQVVE